LRLTGGSVRHNWRAFAFGLLALLLFLFELDGPYLLVGLLAPVVPPSSATSALGLPADNFPPGWNPAQRWDTAAHAGVGILLGGSVLLLLWRPRRRPLLAQFFVASFLVAGPVFIWAALTGRIPGGRPADVVPFAIVSSVIVPGILIALWPGGPREILSLRGWTPLSPGLLALTALVGLFLALAATRALMTEGVLLACLLTLAGLMASSHRPGRYPLGVLVGLGLCYLGVASFMLPLAAGSWGTFGGIFGIAGGLAFIAVAVTSRPLRPPERVHP